MSEKIFEKTKIFNDIIPLEHCRALERNIHTYRKSGDEKRSNLYEVCLENGWISLDTPYLYFAKHQDKYLNIEYIPLIKNLTSIMSEHFEQKFKFESAHLRLYEKNSELKKHIDRNDLDITLSVNVGGLQNWPLKICKHQCKSTSKFDMENCDDFDEFITPIGCGVASYGKLLTHWRDPLVCENNEYVVQMFYHFKIIN